MGLSDQRELADTAINADNQIIAESAIWGITDQEMLFEVYKNAKNRFVCETAFKMITDIKILTEIAADPKLSSHVMTNIRYLACEKSIGHKYADDACFCVVCGCHDHAYVWINDRTMECRKCGDTVTPDD